MNDANRRPMATYRLQFTRDFRFNDAHALVPYFSRLGITHAYASPVLRARQASTHGYDVVDPKTINPNLGDKTDLFNLVAELRRFGLGLVLDIVPNHMAATVENPYWRDVLTYGPSSPFARWFDIDWRMPDSSMWGRVLVPVLGEPRARVLEQDQLRLEWADGRFLVRYFDHVFPVDPATVPMIYKFGLRDLHQCLERDHVALPKMRDLLRQLKKLPRLVARLRRRVNIDREETEQWLAQFAQLVQQSPRIQQWAEQAAERFGQGEEGQARLGKLLDNQPYRLVHWRDAARIINYRRFFDINELVSVRQEDPNVFEETHATLLRWIDEGLIDGVRVDHIDGLRDPLGYLEQLATALRNGARAQRSIPVFVEKILASDEQLPCNWPIAGTTGYEFLNQVETLFVSREGFAEIDKQYRRMFRRHAPFERIAAESKRRVLRNELAPHINRLADTLVRLAETRTQTASAVGNGTESSVTELAGVNDRRLADSSAQHAEGPATSLLALQSAADTLGAPASGAAVLKKRDLIDAIVETIVALPIYRTYVDYHHNTVSDADHKYVEAALQGARSSERAAPEAIDFLGEILLLDNRPVLSDHELRERVTFIQRFQQLTGPAAAKGIEDTALYSYVPLVSLNEVGGEPLLYADDPATALHQANAERAATWPASMLCVTTHDTKRTADVRARLDVLSEIPDVWTDLVSRWRRRNDRYATRIDGKRAPSVTAEYLFYQTIVGLWPARDTRQADEPPAADAIQELRQRIESYMLKAAREAKTNTTWTNPNQPYEDALTSFVRSLLPDADGRDNSFLTDVGQFVDRIARPGFWNSLSRTLIQFASPGTPDLYQGDELWNFALVDPDNRRAVDYRTRQRLLDEVITGIEAPEEPRRAFVQSLVDAPEDGRIKLHVIHSALAARNEHPRLLSKGKYIALAAEGPAKNHVLAFARVASPDGAPAPSTVDRKAATEEAAMIVVPRFASALVSTPTVPPIGDAVWSETVIELPQALRHYIWSCAMTREAIPAATDGRLRVGDVLKSFPVALLISKP